MKPLYKLNNFIISLIRKTTLKKRLLFSFMSICILCSLTVGLLCYNIAAKSLTNKIATTSSQILSTLDPSIYYHMQAYEGLMDQIAFSSIIQSSLLDSSSLTALERVNLYRSTTDLLTSSYSRLPYIKDINIYTNQNESIYGLGYVPLTESHLKLIHNSLSTTTTSVFYPYATQSTNIILMGRNIISSITGNNIGYIVIAIDEQSLLSLYNNVDIGQGSEILITNSSGTILSSNSNQYSFGHSFDLSDPSPYSSENLLTTHFSSPFGWYLVANTPYSYIYSELFTLGKSIIVVVLILLGIFSTLSILIYKSISLPLDTLINYLDSIESSPLTDTLLLDSANDELSYLFQTFNVYIKRINTLIDAIKEEQKQKHSYQLKMLQAQINPHFLFNTLNSLRFVAMMSNVPHLSEGLGALGSLLSNTILHKNELISLKAEIDNLQNYCVIQRIRYGNAFEVIYDLDDALLDLQILKLILQPIVENCILHGIDENKCKETIILKGWIEENSLILTISDDGKGFDIDQTQKQKHNTLSGIGINNINERLSLHFGKEYGLTLYSEIDKGSLVTLTMPIIYEGDECKYA